jgi:MOSC domain-containing protein YiiM
MSSPKGKILAVNIADRKGQKKTNVGSGFLIADYGIQDDAHAGTDIRQVSLLAQESINKMRAKGLDVTYGDFAENLTTEGIDLPSLPIGTRLQLNPGVLLEVTQIGKVCHDRCHIFYTVGDCIMPREGIFVKVIAGGKVKVGDDIEIIAS